VSCRKRLRRRRHGQEEELKGSEDCKVGKENGIGVIPPKQPPPAFGIWFCNNIFEMQRLLLYFCAIAHPKYYPKDETRTMNGQNLLIVSHLDLSKSGC
jgi:hypothetical protein